ncbi:hypothetical protein HDV01_006645 [Terramyces sp. JEL0728]|nr:hypothetical protein HDV01_006645 [Terramyces sp. JEL0728]
MSSDELFIDFTKIPDEHTHQKSNIVATHVKQKKAFANQQEEFYQKARNNRFASVAPPDLAHINTINETIKVTLSEEVATNPATLIKFSDIDLSRVINKVIYKLNLTPGEPSSAEKGVLYDSEEASVEELKSTIKMQNLLLDEIGKSMQTISKQNSDLIASNKKLVQDRIVAYQSRDDLHKLVLEKENSSNSNEAKEKNKERRKPTKRTFLDEAAILDSALEEFRSIYVTQKRKVSTKIENVVSDPTNAKEMESKPEKKAVNFTTTSLAMDDDIGDKNDLHISMNDCISETADILGAQKLFEPPSSFDVEVKRTMENLQHLNNPYKNVRTGIPKRYPETNFNCSHIESLKKYLSQYTPSLSTSKIQTNKDLMETISVETYISKIQQQLCEHSISLHECLDALAEEKRLSRQLRLKIEKIEKKAKNRKLEDNESFFKKKRDLSNILLPISRPSTAIDFDTLPKYFETDEHEETTVIIPTEVLQQPKYRATTASALGALGNTKSNKSARKRPSTTPIKKTSIYIPSIKVGIPFGHSSRTNHPTMKTGDSAIIPAISQNQKCATFKSVPTKQAKKYLETLLA